MEARLRAFYNFLTKRKVKKGEPFTHLVKKSQYEEWYPACYYIPEEDRDKFWEYYCELVYRGYSFTIAERPEIYGPLRIDVDFEATIDSGTHRQYTREMVSRLIQIFQKEIRRIVRPDEFEERMLWCIALEKKSPRIKEEVIVKDGFHLHFPHFICDAWTQDVYLRERVTNSMIQEGIWAGCNFKTPLTDIIDKNMFRKPWMMYGSMNYKDETSTPYMYLPQKHQGIVYDHELREIPTRELFQEEMIGRPQNAKYYLPALLSIRGYPEKTSLKERELEQVKEYRKRRKPIIRRNKGEVEIREDLRKIKDMQLLEMLSDDRRDRYDDWIRVGWALFNIGQGDDEALQMWKDFSITSSKYIEGCCEEEWSRMELRDSGYTMGSLRYWAKRDSPEKYQEVARYGISKLMKDCLYEAKPTEFDVAMVLCEMYRDRFKCVNAKKNIWYEFQGHRWKEVDGEIPLRRIIPRQLKQKFHELHIELSKKWRETESDLDELRIKRCLVIISELKKDPFQNKIISQCKVELYDGEFLRKMDENRNLIGCENGVLDLELGIFRPGEPGDYVTFTTGLFYQEFSEGSFEEKELQEYLLKVFPNPNLRRYFLDFMSSCLKGGNENKRFLVETGDGNNSKSVTVKFLELAFGEYAGKFPQDLLKRGRRNSSAAARPELAQVRGKRIMFCQEIGNDVDEVDVGVLKELTGNDSFFNRNLFEKGAKLVPQFTLLLQCNDPPKIPGHDKATWNRIRVLDYESTFVLPADLKEDPVPKTFREQLKARKFVADPCFEEKLPFLAPVLLWKLFNHYVKVYKTHGLREPDEVLLSTKAYQADNDIYQQYIQDRIQPIEDPLEAKKSYIRLAEMYTDFNEWYRENYPSYRREPIGKGKMKKELVKRLGTIKDSSKEIRGFGAKSRWWGYKFVVEDDEGFLGAIGKKK